MLIKQGVRFPRRCASLPLCVRRKPEVPVDDTHLFSGGFPWPDQGHPGPLSLSFTQSLYPKPSEIIGL